MQKTLKMIDPTYSKACPKEVKIWFDELPDIEDVDICNRISIPANCTKNIALRKYAIEFKKFTGRPHYGLLGFEYIAKTDSSNVEILVDYVLRNKKHYDATISLDKSSVYIGLPIDYTKGIIEETIKEFIAEGNALGPGVLHFRVAANCEVGSSPLIFKWLAKILLELLQVDFENINDEKLNDLILTTAK